MARPKKWANEAERLAAYRANRTESVQPIRTDDPIRTDTPIRTQSVHEHARQVSASAGTVTDTLPGFVAFRDQPHVPHDHTVAPWVGAGRGTPREYRGALYVLVARGTPDPAMPEHGVVTDADWHARLAQHCQHNLAGWSCHSC